MLKESQIEAAVARLIDVPYTTLFQVLRSLGLHLVASDAVATEEAIRQELDKLDGVDLENE